MYQYLCPCTCVSALSSCGFFSLFLCLFLRSCIYIFVHVFCPTGDMCFPRLCVYFSVHVFFSIFSSVCFSRLCLCMFTGLLEAVRLMGYSDGRAFANRHFNIHTTYCYFLRTGHLWIGCVALKEVSGLSGLYSYCSVYSMLTTGLHDLYRVTVP